MEDGDVFTWGRGWDGQLGHEVVTEIELEPRIVPKMQVCVCVWCVCVCVVWCGVCVCV